MSISRRTFSTATAAFAASAACIVALAQDKYPSRPLRIIVPYPAGASTDALARALGHKLSTNMGVAVVVENKPGAAGTMGTQLLANSAPDGYTIGIAVPSTHTLPIALSRKVPYDPIKDFTPLSLVANNPLAVVVNPSVPATTLKELVEYARANPGKLSYGTSGAGTSQHLVGEMLNQFAKINIVHVPYKGGSGALNDLLGGQIQVAFVVVPTVLTHVKAGKLRMLAVIDERRYSELPTVPTSKEALPGFAPMPSWLGVFGPAGLPHAITARLVAELQKAVRDPELASYLNAGGMPVVGSNGEQFAARLRADIDGWTPIVKAGKLSAVD
jgi:tripartite-type tricarboxylate transporter receptor subunit TctC